MMRVGLLFLLVLAAQFVPHVAVRDAAAVTSIDQAYATCKAQRDSNESQGYFIKWGCTQSSGSTATNGAWQFRRCNSPGPEATSCTYQSTFTFSYTVGCATGTWDNASKTCFDAGECLARNADLGALAGQPRPSLTLCRNVAGCKFAMTASGPDYTEVTLPDGAKLYRGVMEYTGDPGSSCTTAPVTPEAEEAASKINPQECVVVPGGGDVPMCIKADGQHCLKAPSSGNQFCWRPGEVGEKAGGPALQKRNAGATTNPPTTPPPENSSFVQDGSAVTTHTTVNNTAITTTFTNFRTDSGVDVGPDDQSEPSDGTGSPAGEDGGAVLDGVDCSSQPVVTGGDPLLANVILQTWGTRCAVESANKVNATGEIGDCSTPWTISGDAGDANVAKLKAARVNICGSDSDNDGVSDAYENTAPSLEDGIASGDTNSDGTGGGTTPGQAFGAAIEADSGDLDWGGWGGYTRTCPTIDAIDIGNGHTLVIPTGALCDIMQTFGHIMLLLSALVSLRIMAGGVVT